MLLDDGESVSKCGKRSVIIRPTIVPRTEPLDGRVNLAPSEDESLTSLRSFFVHYAVTTFTAPDGFPRFNLVLDPTV